MFLAIPFLMEFWVIYKVAYCWQNCLSWNSQIGQTLKLVKSNETKINWFLTRLITHTRHTMANNGNTVKWNLYFVLEIKCNGVIDVFIAYCSPELLVFLLNSHLLQKLINLEWTGQSAIIYHWTVYSWMYMARKNVVL